jgi:hypothetical protein
VVRFNSNLVGATLPYNRTINFTSVAAEADIWLMALD